MFFNYRTARLLPRRLREWRDRRIGQALMKELRERRKQDATKR